MCECLGFGLVLGGLSHVQMNDPVLAEMAVAKYFISKANPDLEFLIAPDLGLDYHAFVP